MTKEEILKEYCLVEVKDIPKDLIGWRVLELIKYSESESEKKTASVLNLLTNLSNTLSCYKTKINRWLGEFNILLSNTIIGTLIIVDQDCPDYYFIEKEELMDPIKQLLISVINVDFSKLEINMTERGYGDGYVYAPFIPPIDTTTISQPHTFKTYDSTSTSDAASLNTLYNSTSLLQETTPIMAPSSNYTLKINYSDSTTC